MLSERDRRILFTVIDGYVGSGEPVSSKRVRELGGYAMSTATIRGRMAALERQGYLAKTHVSSGRIPTDDGYRAYVDGLPANVRALGASERIAGRCREELRTHTRDVSAVMMHASQLLGSLSDNFGVVYGAIEQESRVRRVRLVSMGSAQVLVVVNLEPAHERATTLRFDRELDRAAVEAVERLLGRILSGKTRAQARKVLESTVRDNVTDEGIITREISLRADTIFSEPPAVEVYFEERSRVLEQPELSDPKNLQLILRLLHDKAYLTSILSRRSLEGTEVTIGSEHADTALRRFSLVTAGYRMGAARGVLGVIGPTRMRYDVALAVVDSMSREMRDIGEEFF